MAAILEVKNLVKEYPGVTAVNGLNLAVREGICFGLLGPNGAGKTTTLEMIEGITRPTSGEIRYRGGPVGKGFREAIGIQFQETALQDRLRVGEVLELFGSFYRRTMDRGELIRFCDLGELLERDAGKLSGGQRQRLLLALALVNDPDLVFLDEPTTGLDPHARRNFWDLVKLVRARGKTIVLTTHYMEEAYALCDEIGIMDRGKIIAQGAPDQLLQENFQGLSIRIPRADLTLSASEVPGEVFETDDYAEIHTTRVNDTMRVLLDRGVSLACVQIRSRNLDDLFLELTRKGLRP